MSNPAIDPKRTVKATKLDDYPDDVVAPGACFHPTGEGWGPNTFLFSCPGCQQFGGIQCASPKPEKSPSWDIVSGSLDDPTTLTLAPSIHCVGCCGWHGFLRNGVFESC